VGQGDGDDAPSGHGVGNGTVIVSSVDDQHLPLVADEPDVVGHGPLSAVEGKDAVGSDELDHRATSGVREAVERSREAAPDRGPLVPRRGVFVANQSLGQQLGRPPRFGNVVHRFDVDSL
jgi:hypothetical protein